MRLTVGDPQRDAVEELQRLHRGFTERTGRLERHATMASTAGFEAELHALAAAHAALGEAIAAALRERGAEAEAVPAEPHDGAPRSHWGRLVADLEAARAARNAVVTARSRLLDHDETLAPLFDRLDAGLDAHLAHLRNQIARADPQAIN